MIYEELLTYFLAPDYNHNNHYFIGSILREQINASKKA
jgi:hypothetical protein